MVDGQARTAVARREQTDATPLLTALAWSVGALSIAAFAGAWVLAARNRDVFVAVLSLGVLVALLPFASSSKSGDEAFDATIVAGIGLALPVAIGIAILKYRLYAIDRIISRTVSYVLVTGAVAGVYLGCIAVLTKLLPVRGSLGIAVAVLAAVALFNPLRRRVQTLGDQRFDRARYNAERVVAQFSVQLREEVDLDVLGADLLDVVHHVLAPTHLGLWLNGTVSPSAAPRARADDVTVAQSIAPGDPKPG